MQAPETKTPRDLLVAARRYVVPDFQRPFSWGQEEIDELWRDVLPLVAQPDRRLFLGTMVFEMGDPNRAMIWDGQQRLATLVMVLAAARDNLLRQTGGQALADNVHRYLMGDPLAPAPEPVLTLGEFDRKTFHEFVILRDGDSSKKDLAFWATLTAAQRKSAWSPRVVEAFAFLLGKVADLATAEAARYGGPERALFEFSKVVANQIQIIQILTGSEDEAFRVFETLNDRGLELSAADLVKHFLVSNLPPASPARSEAQNDWDGMVRLIGQDRVTPFLRHYYLSRFGRTTRSELYRKVATLFKPPPQGAGLQIQPFISDLVEAADLYAKLVEPSTGGWASQGLLRSLERLVRLGTVQWAPLILAAQASGMTESDFERIARHVEVLVVRSVTVGGKNPNFLESICGDAASVLYSAVKNGTPPAAALTSLLGTIRGHIPTDATFRARFNEPEPMSKATARFLLECMESEEQARMATGVVPNPPVNDIEHIYPRNPGAGWPSRGHAGFVDPTAREVIGNLTLLHLKKNRSQKNAAFATKKTTYAASPLLLTREIGSGTSSTNWARPEITARQSRLADLAVATWSIP